MLIGTVMLNLLCVNRYFIICGVLASLVGCASQEESPEAKAQRILNEEATAAAQAEQARKEAELPSLAAYLSYVESATFEVLETESEVNDHLTDEKFKKMQRHVLSFYRGSEAGTGERNAVHYFLDTTNHPIDCVLVEKQPTLLHAKYSMLSIEKQPIPIVNQDYLKDPEREELLVLSDVLVSHKDIQGNDMACPEGSVPIRRLLLTAMIKFGSLEAFFYKPPPESPKHFQRPESRAELAGYTHYWAHAWQAVNNKGGESYLNVWQPDVAPGLFSVSQQWYTSGEDDNRQAVEGGWQVAPKKYGNVYPSLFIFHSSQNYAPNKGCYNLECAGFIQVSPHWIIGGRLGAVSQLDAEQHAIRMQWQLHSGNWWLFLHTEKAFEAVGYYPSVAFDDGAITKGADYIDFGSGVLSAQDTPNTGQMGSGRYAVDGWRNAAYQRSIFYIAADDESVWATLSPLSRNAQCYGIELHNQVDSEWGTYIYAGGPSCQ